MTDFFPPTVTGSAEHVRALARGLRRAGHEVSVATIAQKNTISDRIQCSSRVR